MILLPIHTLIAQNQISSCGRNLINLNYLFSEIFLKWYSKHQLPSNFYFPINHVISCWEMRTIMPFFAGNFVIIEPYLFKVEKFQRSLDHPSIKYIYAVLLLTHLSYFLLTLQNIFSRSAPL